MHRLLEERAITPSLLQDQIDQQFGILQADTATKHKVRNLEGDHTTLTKYFPTVMLTAYIWQLIIQVVMVARFISIGHHGYNFWVTSVSMIAWQHFANIVLFFAVFGVRNKWTKKSERMDRPLYEFVFYEGWCGQSKMPSRKASICLGVVFGPLCPVLYFAHWSRWEQAEEDNCRGSVKRCLGGAMEQCGDLVDHRSDWVQSDLEFREGASAPQLFRYLTDPSLFLIIWNAPFAFFQFLIYTAAVLNLDTSFLDPLLVVAVLVSFVNVLLPVWFITPTAFWEWFFLSFFSCSFDLIIIIITGLVHPHYRLMNGYMYNISWFWTWSAMTTCLWIPYWWWSRAKKRLVKAAHVGPRFANLQAYFTQLMGTFFTAVYTGLGQYRTVSWIVEFEFATNKMHFNPAGFFAKVIGWVRLPLGDRAAASFNLSKVNDYDLRVLIANVVLFKYLEGPSDEERNVNDLMIHDEDACLLEIVHGNSLPADSIIHRRQYLRKHVPRVAALAKDKMNLFSLIRRRIEEGTVRRSDSYQELCRREVQSIGQRAQSSILSVVLGSYVMTRLVCWGFFLFTLGSFVYALAVQNMGSNLNNRDVIVIMFLVMQCVNVGGIVYYGFRSYQVWETSWLIVSYVETARLPVEAGAEVFIGMVQLYDDVIQDAGTSCVLEEFFVDDLTKIIQSYVEFNVTKTYLDELRSFCLESGPSL